MRAASPLAGATAFPVQPDIVRRCLDLEARPTDALFARALDGSLHRFSPSDRARLAGITGHVGESAAELILVEHGWTPVWHFTGPGGHGVDLLMLDPTRERLVAVEVKATFRKGRWPRLTGGIPPQMDASWLDKPDNPAMLDWGLSSNDLYGGVMAMNFRDLLWKAAFTDDLRTWQPVGAEARLDDLPWLREA